MPNTATETPMELQPAEAIRSVGESIDHAAEKAERAVMFGINSSVVRTILQGGFALLVGYMFYDQLTTQKSLMAGLISKTEERHQRAEEMFREEVREQRKAHWEATKDLRIGMDGVKNAVDRNTEAQHKTTEEIKKLVKDSVESP